MECSKWFLPGSVEAWTRASKSCGAGGEGCWSSLTVWFGRGDWVPLAPQLVDRFWDRLSGFHCGWPIFTSGNTQYPIYPGRVEKASQLEVDGVNRVDLLLIHKGPGWPFNTQSERMFTDWVQTLARFCFFFPLKEIYCSMTTAFKSFWPQRWCVEKLDLFDADLITGREHQGRI